MRTLGFVAVLALILYSGGCASWDKLRGSGFTGADGTWASRLRPKDSEGRSFGFSTKAQQIERDLGVP